MNLDTLTNRSPYSDSVDASDGGNVNVTRVEVGQKMTAVLLAMSVMVNIGCFWEMFTVERETRLKEYDLTQFQSSEFAPAEARVSALAHRVDEIQMRLDLRQEVQRK